MSEQNAHSAEIVALVAAAIDRTYSGPMAEWPTRAARAAADDLAPLLAAAWDNGFEAGYRQSVTDDRVDYASEETANPHRVGQSGAEVVYGVLLDDLGSFDEYATREQAEQMNTASDGRGVVRITQELLTRPGVTISPTVATEGEGGAA